MRVRQRLAVGEDDGMEERYSVCDDYLNAHPASRDVFTSATLSDCIMSVLESGGAEQNQEDLLNLLGMSSRAGATQGVHARGEAEPRGDDR